MYGLIFLLSFLCSPFGVYLWRCQKLVIPSQSPLVQAVTRIDHKQPQLIEIRFVQMLKTGSFPFSSVSRFHAVIS
jgi:hypothetical protein